MSFVHAARANTARHRRIVVCSRHSARHTPCFGGFGFVKTRPRRFFTRLPNELRSSARPESRGASPRRSKKKTNPKGWFSFCVSGPKKIHQRIVCKSANNRQIQVFLHLRMLFYFPLVLLCCLFRMFHRCQKRCTFITT